MGFHRHARYTKDLDIWVNATLGNSEKLLTTLDVLGFGSRQLTIDDFLETGPVVQLGREPVRIDLLTSVKRAAVFRLLAATTRN